MVRQPSVACLALDFGGTIAVRGPSPGARDVADVLLARFGYLMPSVMEDALEDARAQAAQAHRRCGRQTPWETILTVAARRAGADIPDPGAVASALWESVPDAVVDQAAAVAAHQLYQSGHVLILACNTQRPPASRERTLASAGLTRCFAGLVLSSALGVGKPNPAFYAAVSGAARRTAGCGPDGIVFVGDTLRADVTGPLKCGMRAVLLDAGPLPAELPADVPVIAHLADLRGLLERWP